jgi:hypothetical protein
MMHDTIKPVPSRVEGPDPDLDQAIRDFLPLAAEIRERSARVLKLKPGSDARRYEMADIRRLMDDIGTRADRLGLTGQALMVLLNDALDARARRGRGAPARPTARTLLSNLLNAEAALRNAQLEEQAARAKVKAYAAALAAAQSAHAAYAGGRLVADLRPEQGRGMVDQEAA